MNKPQLGLTKSNGQPHFIRLLDPAGSHLTLSGDTSK